MRGLSVVCHVFYARRHARHVATLSFQADCLITKHVKWNADPRKDSKHMCPAPPHLSLGHACAHMAIRITAAAADKKKRTKGLQR